MELKDYLQPIPYSCLPEHVAKKSWLNTSLLHIDNFPDAQEADLVIFGLDDGCADAVRGELYRLVQTYELKIVDLGNITRALDTKDTEFAIGAVIRELVDRRIMPLFIASDPDWIYSVYKSYEKYGTHVSYGCFDARISLWDPEGQAAYLNRIITHRPNFLFNISQLGYQTYFVEPDTTQAMEKMFFDTFRLGWVNAHIEETEPILRGSDLLSLNINSIRLSDAPGQIDGSPNGFFGDEICRITRYAGMSSKLTAFGLFGYDPSIDQQHQTAKLMAQMIWYFVDGLMARTRENPEENPEGFTKFVIGLKDNAHHINFYKSNRTDRWWMDVPNPHHRAEHHGPFYVPCSYKDYQQACLNEIPERWWNAYQKWL